MKVLIRFLFLILLVSCQHNNSPSETLQDDDAWMLHQQIDSVFQGSNFNGLILIASDSTPIFYQAYGFSNLEQQTPLLKSDQFVIGSISKQITAVLVMQAYEAGDLNLHDPISRYLTEIEQAWAEEVSIHHLLTHTHGIRALDQELQFEPGSRFQYSQLGYALLAQILETQSGLSFENLASNLFASLGMRNTHHPESQEHTHLVKGYEADEQGKLVYASNSLENYAAAGSFISTAEDLWTWNRKLYSGELVSEHSLDVMRTKYASRIHPIFDSIDYGYGLLFRDGWQGLEIGALGYAPGFASASYYYPQLDWHLVVLENTAYQLSDFKHTFKVHTALMEILRNRGTVE